MTEEPLALNLDGGLLSVANGGATSKEWLSKTSQQILEDVNALLATFTPPQKVAYMSGMDQLDRALRRVQDVPIRGAYWDFDKLIIPAHYWHLFWVPLMRKRLRWYRTKRPRRWSVV